MFSKDLQKRKRPFKSSKEARKALFHITLDEIQLGCANHLLSTLIKERPAEVYAIALDLLRDHKLPAGIDKVVEEIARSAARQSLRDLPPRIWNAKMDVKFDDYTHFTSYYLQCSIRLDQFLVTEELIKKTGTEWVWFNSRCGVCPLTTQSIVVPIAALGIKKHPTTWWVEYWEKVVSAIGECPCEDWFKDSRIWSSTLWTLEKECPTCYRRAAEEYPRFNKMVIDITIDIIKGVSIHVSIDLSAKA